MSDEGFSQYLVSQSTTGGKFWEVEVVGVEMRTRYGKIGQDKAWSAKGFPTHEKAVQAAKKKASSKRSKGYSIATRTAPVDGAAGGNFAARAFQGVIYFRALERYPGGNGDMWVIKLTLTHQPGQPVGLVCRMVGNWDGSGWATDDKQVELDFSETLPAFLAAAEALVEADLFDTNDTILDPRTDHEEYDTEWSSIECALTVWPEGQTTIGNAEDGRLALRVIQRALSFTTSCSPPEPATAGFIERLQALVGIGRVEPWSDGGSTKHYGEQIKNPTHGHGALPMYL